MFFIDVCPNLVSLNEGQGRLIM